MQSVTISSSIVKKHPFSFKIVDTNIKISQRAESFSRGDDFSIQADYVDRSQGCSSSLKTAFEFFTYASMKYVKHRSAFETCIRKH